MRKASFILIVITLFTVSCAHEEEHQHDEHVDKIQFTEYTNDFELFAEADIFILAEPSNILSHFTKLPDFNALESGSITMRLRVGNKEVNQTLDKPDRKGIYSFDIVPTVAGKGHLIFEIGLGEAMKRLVVKGIIVYNSHAEAHEAEEDDEMSPVNATVFTKEQSWKVDFKTQYPDTASFGQVIKATAQVKPAHGDEVLLTARMDGMVVCFAEDVIIGKPVKRGQVLFTISGSGLADNNSAVRYNEAKNNYEKAKRSYERAKELAKDKIVSEGELLEAENQYENARIIYNNLQKNFSASGQNITSPKDGFINQLFAEHGQFVEAGQPVVNISENKILILTADVRQKYSNVLKDVTSATLRSGVDNKIWTLEELNGSILAYGHSTNRDNFMIPFTLQINNNGSFVPGGFVEVFLKASSGSNVPTVPNTSLLEEQGIFYVFVQHTPELFEKREVRTGASDGLSTQIMEGLSVSDRIVSRGSLNIKLAEATGTLDAHSGHVH